MGLPVAICNDVSAIMLNNLVPPDYFFLGTTAQGTVYSITTSSGVVVDIAYSQFSEWSRRQITYEISIPGHRLRSFAVKNVIQAGPAAGRRAMAAAIRQLALAIGFYVEVDANEY